MSTEQKQQSDNCSSSSGGGGGGGGSGNNVDDGGLNCGVGGNSDGCGSRKKLAINKSNRRPFQQIPIFVNKIITIFKFQL